MPSDDLPFDALQRHFEMEEASVSPVAKKIVELTNRVPLPWPLSKVVEGIREALIADSAERVQLLLEACINELRRQDSAITALKAELATADAALYSETAKDLLIDAARKAEATRAKERIKRIGIILASGLSGSANPSGDEIEEMMRIAMELSDSDVDFLRELVRVEGDAVKQNGRLSR